MKTATIRLNCRSIIDAGSVISQLNHLAANKSEAVPYARFLHAARKEGTTGIVVTLTNLTKKEAVLALRDILRTYKCFDITGQLICYNALQKREEKVISMPIDFEDQACLEIVDNLNKQCHAKFTEEDLMIC